MKKYYILAFTFLCLLMGQNTYSQDWNDAEMSNTVHCEDYPAICDALSGVFDEQINSFGLNDNGRLQFITYDVDLAEIQSLGLDPNANWLDVHVYLFYGNTNNNFDNSDLLPDFDDPNPEQNPDPYNNPNPDDFCYYYPTYCDLNGTNEPYIYVNTISTSTESGSVHSINLNNTFTNNTSAYQNISQRNHYYAWVDTQVESLNLEWFKAADLVTRWYGVGAADLPNMGFLLDSSEDFLRKGNEYLFKFNMENAKNLIINGELNGSFINGVGDIVVLDGKTGVDLDYAMVEFEQTKINSFIVDYQITNGLSDAEMNAIMDDITLTMRRHSLYEVNEIMNTNFNGGDDFSFGNYHDRVVLGQLLIDKLHQ